MNGGNISRSVNLPELDHTGSDQVRSDQTRMLNHNPRAGRASHGTRGEHEAPPDPNWVTIKIASLETHVSTILTAESWFWKPNCHIACPNVVTTRRFFSTSTSSRM